MWCIEPHPNGAIVSLQAVDLGAADGGAGFREAIAADGAADAAHEERIGRAAEEASALLDDLRRGTPREGAIELAECFLGLVLAARSERARAFGEQVVSARWWIASEERVVLAGAGKTEKERRHARRRRHDHKDPGAIATAGAGTLLGERRRAWTVRGDHRVGGAAVPLTEIAERAHAAMRGMLAWIAAPDFPQQPRGAIGKCGAEGGRKALEEVRVVHVRS